jgi:prepilin-type processing-associated H-X9-DG protein
LIELLVVIAIISLLVSILLPSLSRAKELARGVVCLNNVRHLMLAMLTYEGDWNVWPGMASCGGSTPEYDRWLPHGGVYGYVGRSDFDVADGSLYPYAGSNRALFVCPSAEGSKLAYAVNRFVYLTGEFPQLEKADRPPAELIALVDEGNPNDGWFAPICSPYGYNNSSLDSPDWFHNRQASFGFADAHVEMRSEDDLEIVGWDFSVSGWGPKGRWWWPFD